MPGTAKIICIFAAWRMSPNQPCSPKSSTKIRPDITGETVKGKSISVVRTFLPTNSNLAIAQDAATPNSMLSGTAIAAVISVSWMAARSVVFGDRREVNPQSLLKSLGEDHHQRQKEEKREEEQG